MITITGTSGNDTLSAAAPGQGFSLDLSFGNLLIDIEAAHSGNLNLVPNVIANASFALSHSGDMIAFVALGLNNNFVANEINSGWDLYAVDRTSTSLDLITARDDGTQPATLFNAAYPAFSPNDEQIAFISDSAFLDGVDTNSREDLFVKNLLTEELVRVTDSELGVQADGHTRGYIWLDDDRLLIDSDATNLVDGETHDDGAFYIKNIVTGNVSVLEFGAFSARDIVEQLSGLNRIEHISVSSDGRYFTFTSEEELDGSSDDGLLDVYVFDTVTEQFTRASTDSNGDSANLALSGNIGSRYADISPDGNMVAFISDSGSFAPSDTNSVDDVFLKNLQTGELIRISVPNEGGEISQFTAVTGPKFSPDGTMLMFALVNQVANSGGLLTGVYIWSAATGELEKIEVPTENGLFIPASIYLDSRGIDWLPDSSGIIYTSETVPIEILFNPDSTEGAVINGLSGADTITGSRNADVLIGGNGNDLVYGGKGDDDISGGNGSDVLNGGDGADHIEGGGNRDTINGGDGNDELLGFAGTDTIHGGSGNDTISGGNHNDTIIGGNGHDTISGGNSNDTLSGNNGNDYISGNNGIDIIFGGNGADTLIGGGNRDTLFGEDGDDKLIGGRGNDELNGGLGNDNLNGGTENDILFGENGNDFLRGSSGNDTLNGGNGADTLNGGSGADTLIGGNKLDTFVFAEGDSLLGARDTITDLAAGETIDLAAHAFVGTGAFTSSGQFEVRYVSGATTVLELDYDGDGTADEAIDITGNFDFTSDGHDLTAVLSSPDAPDMFA